jgi:hypothetical protein
MLLERRKREVVTLSPEQYLASVMQFRDAAQQRAFISDTPISSPPDFLELLANRVRELLPRDLDMAEILAETGLHVAGMINTPLAAANATRAKAQVLYTRKQCADAQPMFERAVELFSSAGCDPEIGRTLVVQMDNMSYLGMYEEAIQLEPRARRSREGR